MPEPRPTPLARGVRAPDFVLPLAGGGPTQFYARAGGRPALVVFAATPEAAGFGARVLKPEGVSVHYVLGRGSETSDLDGDVFVDDGSVHRSYGLADGVEPAMFVLDANLRVLGFLRDPEDVQLEAFLAEGREGGSEAARFTIDGQAPVLFVPRALPEEACVFLMNLWERGGHRETGVERTTSGGRQDVLAEEAKRRRDHVVSDEGLIERLTQSIGRRVLPELRKAFAYEATRFEGFKIACYEAAAGGFFDAHRDNLSPSTAHRRFAMSLNLNADYEGGELRFPEYGNARYRAGAGEALIFACGILHEVVPVTAARRFTLLSFLFGDEGSRQSPGRTGGGRPTGFDPFAA